MGVAEAAVDRVGVGLAALERQQRVDDTVEALVRLVAEDLEELGVAGLAHGCNLASSAANMSCDVDHARRSAPSSSAAPCEVARISDSWTAPASARDVGDLVDGEAGDAARPPSSTTSMRGPAFARNAEDAREVEDGQHLRRAD